MAPCRRSRTVTTVLPAAAFALLSIVVAWIVSPYYYQTKEQVVPLLLYNVIKTDLLWAIAQWCPKCQPLQEQAWNDWQRHHHDVSLTNHRQQRQEQQEIAVVDMQRYGNDHAKLLQYLVDTYGTDWRKRPLLLRRLWTQEQLSKEQQQRHLSVESLLQQEMQVPYFTDARQKNALTPDGTAPIKDIVANMTRRGAPHKIGSQLLVQQHPEWAHEIAPIDRLTALFGDYFDPKHIRRWGPFNLLPGLTTVPVFIAHSKKQESFLKERSDDTASLNNSSHPFTALHCEPIANVAVQLSGAKEWTLVAAEHWRQLHPALAHDGRAYFVSKDWNNNNNHNNKVPVYRVTTAAGDALWLPTWTWHRVDYYYDSTKTESGTLSIAASFFQFRLMDVIVTNPIFAVLVIPAIVLELVGSNTQ